MQQQQKQLQFLQQQLLLLPAVQQQGCLHRRRGMLATSAAGTGHLRGLTAMPSSSSKTCSSRIKHHAGLLQQQQQQLQSLQELGTAKLVRLQVAAAAMSQRQIAVRLSAALEV
jgi:hypothetical protein